LALGGNPGGWIPFGEEDNGGITVLSGFVAFSTGGPAGSLILCCWFSASTIGLLVCCGFAAPTSEELPPELPLYSYSISVVVPEALRTNGVLAEPLCDTDDGSTGFNVDASGMEPFTGCGWGGGELSANFGLVCSCVLSSGAMDNGDEFKPTDDDEMGEEFKPIDELGLKGMDADKYCGACDDDSANCVELTNAGNGSTPPPDVAFFASTAAIGSIGIALALLE